MGEARGTRGWAVGHGIAGAVAAAVALGVSELIASADTAGVSLVSAVGDELIDLLAASLKDIAVELFGTNDKAALVVGIVVVALAVGAWIGVAASRRAWIGPAGFAAFGIVGAWAYARAPLTDAGVGVAAAVVGSIAGMAALVGLSRLLHPASAPSWPAPLPWGPGPGRPADVEAPGGPGLGGSPPSPTPSPTGPALTAPAPVHSAAASGADDGVLDGGRLRRAPVTPGAPAVGTATRRRFVVAAGALGVGGVVAATAGRRLRGPDPGAVVREELVLPTPQAPAPAPLATPFREEGLSPFITPTADFYRIDTALTIPRIDPGRWRLAVTGLVAEPFELTFDELLALESVEETVTLQCVSNEVGGDLVGNATWQGVPLGDLLDRAGARDEATQVVGRSVDGFTAGFPTAAARDGRTALVAYAMNGEPLTPVHGFPVRLVVAGLYGYVSATKWLDEIELTRWDDFSGYWIPRGWAKEGPIKTASRIDVPRAGAELEAGPVVVAGVAWAPTVGISAVELSVDDGPWQPCELAPVAGDETWVQWRLVWAAEPGQHVLAVRAIDGAGEPQTAAVAPPAPNGSSGHHARRVRVAS